LLYLLPVLPQVTFERSSHIIADLYKSYSEKHSLFEEAILSKRFPVFEVFRYDTGLSVRVRSTYLLASIRSELVRLGLTNPLWTGRTKNYHSYWEDELQHYDASLRFKSQSLQVVQTDIGTNGVVSNHHSTPLNGWECFGGGSKLEPHNWRHQKGENESEDEGPENCLWRSEKSEGQPDYLDIDYKELLKLRPFLTQLWESANTHSEQGSPSSRIDIGGFPKYYPYDFRELKLFVVDFLEDKAVFDVSKLGTEPQQSVFSTLQWHGMQDKICEKRISRLRHLFDHETTETLDISDAYMDLLLDPEEFALSTEHSNGSQPSGLSLRDLETVINSLQKPPSYLEEMSSFGFIFPETPDLSDMNAMPDVEKTVQNHRHLLLANPDLLSQIDKEVSRQLRRKLLQRNVRRALKRTCMKLGSLSQREPRLQALALDNLHVWQVGVRAINQVLHNSAPRSFQDTMCLILVAETLRSVGVGILPDKEAKPFCSPDEYVGSPSRCSWTNEMSQVFA
jgi:hypothetical protein